MRNTRYVQKSSSGGGWDVIKQGHVRATAHGSTKDEAIKEARKAVRRDGGGEVRVMNRAGKIVTSDTVRRNARGKKTSAA